MVQLQTVEDFKNLVQQIENSEGYQRPQAFGIGIATIDGNSNMLDCYFPYPNYESNYSSAAILAKVLGYLNTTCSFILNLEQLEEIISYFKPFEGDGKNHPNIEILKVFEENIKNGLNERKSIVVSFIAPFAADQGSEQVADAYLRLHLLSHRLVKPHGINLTGIFKILPNVAWTNEGPIAMDELEKYRLSCVMQGKRLTINSVDKFPRMTDYVVPTGVRIADASRIRLGAYLGEGTTVMHEGFVNFNAGCEGPNMIEGRIAAGVFIKKDTDLGGGASTMGTLSGGGNIVIAIGEKCLIGANAGVGIPLGDRCTIEAGLYITAGTKVKFDDRIVKAKELASYNDILFRRNSLTGQIEVISKANTQQLNDILHSNI